MHVFIPDGSIVCVVNTSSVSSSVKMKTEPLSVQTCLLPVAKF